MKKMNAYDILSTSPIVPVIEIKKLKDAVPIAKALTNAGVKVLEITLRTQYGLEAIHTIKKQVPEAIVGAGTVVNTEQYALAVKAGAEFIISPGITDSLLKKSTEYEVPFIPGIATPSELILASQYRLSCLKFFPAEINGGVNALRAFKGPFPEVRFCPTGGINEKNYHNYLALSNVLCVGGSWFVPNDAIEHGDFGKITSLAKSAIDKLEKTL